VARKFGFAAERRISYLESSLKRLQARRSEVVERLNELNMAYSSGIVDYENYLHRRHTILEGRTAERWDYEYKVQESQITEAIEALTTEKARVDFKTSAKKAFAFATAFMLILAAIAGLPLQPQVTGFASGTFESEANITAYFAVSSSGNLSDGIAFGTITAGTNDNNASENNGTGTETTLYRVLSNDSNVPVDFCIKADGDLFNVDSVPLGLGNMTWDSSLITDESEPSLESSTSLTTSYVISDSNIASNATDDKNVYYRLWLDVPLGQEGGTYNNTIFFESVQTGTGC